MKINEWGVFVERPDTSTYEIKLNEAKDQANKIINDAKESAILESESLVKATEEKIQSEIKQTEERVSQEKSQALGELNTQLKESATNFISKITNLDKDNIKI